MATGQTMLDSIVFYAGAVTVAGGAIGTLSRRHRRHGAVLIAAGALAMGGALFWPVTEHRAAANESRLDDVMPVWEFGESHTIHVAGTPERTFAAIRNVTAGEIALFRALTFLRRFGRAGEVSILNAPPDEPVLAVATRSGFRLLADDPPREIVVGTRIGPATVAVMNFLVTPERGGVILSTETRVHASTASGRRAFAIYWRIIHPGSDIIRRMWLRAIRARAERV